MQILCIIEILTQTYKKQPLQKKSAFNQLWLLYFILIFGCKNYDMKNKLYKNGKSIGITEILFEIVPG